MGHGAKLQKAAERRAVTVLYYETRLLPGFGGFTGLPIGVAHSLAGVGWLVGYSAHSPPPEVGWLVGYSAHTGSELETSRNRRCFDRRCLGALVENACGFKADFTGIQPRAWRNESVSISVRSGPFAGVIDGVR